MHRIIATSFRQFAFFDFVKCQHHCVLSVKFILSGPVKPVRTRILPILRPFYSLAQVLGPGSEWPLQGDMTPLESQSLKPWKRFKSKKDVVTTADLCVLRAGGGGCSPQLVSHPSLTWALHSPRIVRPVPSRGTSLREMGDVRASSGARI